LTISTGRNRSPIPTCQDIKFGWYEAGIVSLLAYLTVFSFTDLFTTSAALAQRGLYESNTILVFIANSLGLNLIGVIAITKLAFVTGAIFLSVLGIRSNDKITRKMIFATVGAFTIIFVMVSLNNLYWIAQTA